MGFPSSVLLKSGDEFVETSDQRHPLGTRGYTRDGRVFRYAKAGSTALSVGLLMAAAGTDSDYNVDLNPATATAPTTASTAITLELATASTIALNELKEGYLRINDGTGEGQVVIIEGNTANTGAATGTFDVYIREESFFTVAPTTACEMGATKNKYDDVVVRPDSARVGVPLGVTPRAVTGDYFFWLQTWGPCACKVTGTPVVGNPIGDDTVTSTGTAGAMHELRGTSTNASAAAGAPQVGLGMSLGNVMEIGADGETALIDLKIDP